HGPGPGRQQLPNRLPALDLLTPDASAGLRGTGAPGPPRPAGPTRSRALLHVRSTRATAQQATPSPRPRAPRASARLGLTVTAAPPAWLRRPCIWWRWGASLGASS